MGVRHVRRGADIFQVSRWFSNVMIGGQPRHDRVICLAHPVVQQVRGGKANRRCGVSADGLGEDMRLGNTRELLPDSCSLFEIGHDPLARRWKQRREACHGLLEHRVAANNIEQLFWRACAAAWPEARSTAARENYCVRGQFFSALFAVLFSVQGCTTRDHSFSSTRSSASRRTNSLRSGTYVRSNVVGTSGTS